MRGEIVLEVAGEGGGYSVARRRDERGAWRFALVREDIFSDADQLVPEEYESLREALKHINTGWPRLRAKQVHPEFAALVYELALARLGADAPALKQWAVARDGAGYVKKLMIEMPRLWASAPSNLSVNADALRHPAAAWPSGASRRLPSRYTAESGI